MVILETRNVCEYYRTGTRAEVRAVDEVSLQVTRGNLVALTGPSGSGKTTLLALLGALERPTRGQVLFDGADLTTWSDAARARARRRLGFVFQNFALIPSLPVWENVTYPLVPRGVGRSERRRLAAELLVRLGLSTGLTARPEELSGGEQQRVAVARALVGRPEVMLADEPTSNLDEASAKEVAALLREIHAEGTTVVLATHDAQLVSRATMVYRLQAGRLKNE
jgi:putative ABC transport system ATP-binding protein